MDWSEFLADPQGLVIAPAGHGKTHAIAECLKQCGDGRQLVLTHTHAGIVAIQKKLKKMQVASTCYHIETIAGFAQSLVLSFLGSGSLPSREDKAYFPKVTSEACRLLAVESLRKVMRISYKSLFVDEYQDCNDNQHKLIMQLTEIMPTHIFGDEMQGIFAFDGATRDFHRELADFKIYDVLKTPWRWKVNGNSKALGQWILNTRHLLEQPQPIIRLTSDADAHVRVVVRPYDPGTYYGDVGKEILKLQTNSILVIVPSYQDDKGWHGGTADRARIRPRFDFARQFTLVEAIDERTHYSVARDIEGLINSIRRARYKYDRIFETLEKLTLSKTELSNWHNEKNHSLKSKRDAAYKKFAETLKSLCDNFIANPQYNTFRDLLTFVRNGMRVKISRPDLFYTILHCLSEVPNDGSLVTQVASYKNVIRRCGRKIEGKCIGTTLLTKGLEFDAVVILQADKFEDARNFYVAISRACKELVIFTEKTSLQFK